MKIAVFASGSGGNCTLVTARGCTLLIDAGISMRRISEGLKSCALSFDSISGVLITHEHSDHIMGLKMLIKHHKLPVYAPRTVANRLRGMLPDIDECLHIIPVGECFKIGKAKVLAFHTPHDTDESVGYRIEAEGRVYAHATDMGCVTEEIRAGLMGANTVLIESNHDERMLCDGPYPFQLKKRILSDRGHLSNENCARLARELIDGGTGQVILGHLSRENNTPELAYNTCLSAIADTGARLMCAPVSGCMTAEV